VEFIKVFQEILAKKVFNRENSGDEIVNSRLLPEENMKNISN